MFTLNGRRGDRFHIADILCFTVLEFESSGVKFGVCPAKQEHSLDSLLEHITKVCRHAACHFWYPRGGCCTLVLSCRKGYRLSLTSTGYLALLDVTADDITLGIEGMRVELATAACLFTPLD